MPGVSTNTICPSGMFFTREIRFRVVCGLSETIATFAPTMRLSSVDLPAFGRPMSETNPACGTQRASRSTTPASCDANADLVDAAALGLEHLDVHPVELERLADGRHAADRVKT